jgi:peptide/nickel transport system permease protein
MPEAPLPIIAAAPPSRCTRLPPPLVLFGIGWLTLMLAVALLADVISPYGYTALDLRNRLSPPVGMGGTWLHPLGTDELGRDVLARLIYSIRTSLLIAFGATIIGALVGTTLGFLAAHFRGLVEQAVLALVDFSASLPFLILALAVLAFFGNSMVLLSACSACMPGNATPHRARPGAERRARRAMRRRCAARRQPWRIYGRHVPAEHRLHPHRLHDARLPRDHPAGSGLSFLGLGVQPPETSLGSMVGYGREYLTRAPWILLAPSVTIVLTTLSVSLIGDWLRDRLDPTLR